MLTQSMLRVVINLIGKKIAILTRLKPAFMSIKVALHEDKGVCHTKDKKPFVLGSMTSAPTDARHHPAKNIPTNCCPLHHQSIIRVPKSRSRRLFFIHQAQRRQLFVLSVIRALHIAWGLVAWSADERRLAEVEPLFSKKRAKTGWIKERNTIWALLLLDD